MHTNNQGLGSALLGAIVALALLVTPTVAIDTTNVAFVQTHAGTTSIPIGHAEFCQSRPDECRPNAQIVPSIALTETLWQQLLHVNAQVNATVIPVTDQDLYQVTEFWTYPNGYGDCEDYVLAKRRELINAGWPASTLLIAVVKQANGEGHAVLMARTDRGDLVLDNQVGSIDLWSATPYQFIKRQSQANAGQWVDMIDNREVVVATAGIN
ncbi:transglutaminase-like cysteine peptidase [Devosia sp.]|uniref:transglutaminase-like cysteine peptidase n=1 Tax=Devosia sp. TaxID=1871048 RepID=UPI0027375E6D|nr:transglutaminase-like cysteine peptidase [Devosia sp.]MDP2780973.1 transglutaminase-like cysteine peptidase [Devosia sp.]